MNKSKKAFSLVELIIAVFISAVILIIVMSYIADTFNEIATSSKKSKSLIQLYEAENKLKTLKSQYLSGSILINNSEWVWSDIVLLKTSPLEPNQSWYLFAQVDKNTLEVDPDDNVDNIWKKHLAFRKISSTEISELLSDSSEIYNYKFNLDELFLDILIKDFQVTEYSPWNIFEVSLSLNLDYNEKLDGSKFSEIWNDWIEKIIFNF